MLLKQSHERNFKHFSLLTMKAWENTALSQQLSDQGFETSHIWTVFNPVIDYNNTSRKHKDLGKTCRQLIADCTATYIE